MENSDNFYDKLIDILKSYREEEDISEEELKEITELCSKYDINNNMVKTVEEKLKIQQKSNPHWELSVDNDGEIGFWLQDYRDYHVYKGKIIDHSHIKIESYKYSRDGWSEPSEMEFNIDEENIFKDFLFKYR